MAVSDNNQVSGNPMAYTKRSAFTPAFNAQALSIASSNVGYQWREGEHWCADICIAFNAQSSAVVIDLTLPTFQGQNITINSAVISAQGSVSFAALSLMGSATWFDASGGGARDLVPVNFTGTQIRFHHNAGLMAGTDLAATDSVKALLKIPIYEWR